MNDNLEEAALAYKRTMVDFITPIQQITVRAIKDEEFEKLHNGAVRLMRIFKGEKYLPKDILDEIYFTYKVVRNEAEYYKGEDKAKLQEMADKIETCFSLILGDEVPEDRQPGVPRIF